MVNKLINATIQFWTKEVWRAWDTLPFDRKLIWFLVLNHTIALITIVEILVLKKN